MWSTHLLKSTTFLVAAAMSVTAAEAQNQATLSSLMPYGPTNIETAGLLPADVEANLPAGGNIKDSLFLSDAFWIDHKDELTERWNNWATQ